MTAPADRVELSTSAIARLLASDMREELLALMREIFDRHAFAERLAYSPEEAAELLSISRELVHDLLRTGQPSAVTWFAVEASCCRWAGHYADVGVLREEGPQEQGSPPGD